MDVRETWRLTNKTMWQLNGTNSRMLARFTAKTIPQEAHPWSTSFDLVISIRKCRMRWLGHILLVGKEQPEYHSMVEQSRQGRSGNLLMDSPICHSNEQLAQIACTGVHLCVISSNFCSTTRIFVIRVLEPETRDEKLTKTKKEIFSKKNRINNDLLFYFI